MKKIIIILAVALSSFTVFAGEGVSSKVLDAFNKEFTGAKEVQWTNADEYYKASFVFNGQNVSAFYQTDGDLIAVTRNISSLEVPISLQTNLKNKYGSYWISDLFELSNREGTSYYITLENADSKVVLRSQGNGKWDSFKKFAKL